MKKKCINGPYILTLSIKKKKKKDPPIVANLFMTAPHCAIANLHIFNDELGAKLK